VFHRPGWCYRPEASSLSRARFTLRAEYHGFVYEPPDLGLDALHSGATAHTAQSSGFERETPSFWPRVSTYPLGTRGSGVSGVR